MEDRTARLLLWTMHAGFFAILLSSTLRLAARHGSAAGAGTFALAGFLAVLYGSGVVARPRPGRARTAWLLTVVATWLVLVWLAPSFAWCAIPLGFLALRLLPRPLPIAVVAALTAAAMVAQFRVDTRHDASMVLGPLAVSAMVTVIVVALQRLVAELTRTRGELAAAQRSAGVHEERERLAREIHDTLAQGFTSVGMLLQAAQRAWDTDPDAAREHVGRAERVSAAELAEARRFVRGLAPYDLASGSLAEALRALVGRAPQGVDLRCEGTEFPLPAEAQEALLRVAQGALANAREHAAASRTVVTLAFLDDGTVALDVADDGSGFDPAAVAPGEGRGYGLRTMRDRLAAVGGSLAVESAPGRGTVVAATIRREETP